MKGKIVICPSPSFRVECATCVRVYRSPCKDFEEAEKQLMLLEWEKTDDDEWLCPYCSSESWKKSLEDL